MFSQVKIGENPSQINSYSLLELESTDKVFVLNKMTSSQMEAIQPLEGALVYNLNEKCIFIYESSLWKSLCNNGSDNQSLTFDSLSNIITLENGGSIDLSVYINSDDQVLSFNNSTNVLTLEDGGMVDLTKFLDDTNTDEQEITDFSVNGSNVLSITLENGNTQTVDLSSLNNSGTDDQALSFDNSSNVLTLEDGGTVDLTKFLDDTNTDEQEITDFSINGSNILSITLENGNTQTVDMSSYVNNDTNELQSLSQSGTDVSLSNGGGTISVADNDNDSSNELQSLSQSGNDVTLSNSGGTISFTKETIGYIFAALHHSGANGNGAILYQINNSVTGSSRTTRTNTGRYNVRFSTPHPNGANYPISLGVRVDGNRDGRIIQVVDGTQNANGFNVVILTGDNGTAADPYVDSHWYFNVSATKEVITNISVN